MMYSDLLTSSHWLHGSNLINSLGGPSLTIKVFLSSLTVDGWTMLAEISKRLAYIAKRKDNGSKTWNMIISNSNHDFTSQNNGVVADDRRIFEWNPSSQGKVEINLHCIAKKRKVNAIPVRSVYLGFPSGLCHHHPRFARWLVFCL